jgi:hypothetical protein
MSHRRLWSAAALLLALAAVVLAVVVAVAHFPEGLSVLACVALAICSAWYGALRRGTARALGLGAAAILLGGAVVLVIVGNRLLEDLLVVAAVALALVAARMAFRVHVELPRVGRPARPVLFYTRFREAGRPNGSIWPMRPVSGVSNRSSCDAEKTSRNSSATR